MDKPSLKPSLKLLLVEDEIFNRDLAKILLEKCGHRVFPAANGLEAIKILSHTDVDAILMDDHMPVLDGVSAAKIIRNCEKGIVPDLHPHKDLLNALSRKIKGTHIPIFALTAHAMPGDRKKYLEAGMDDYFTKPFEPEDVLANLTRFESLSG